jgi:hypothetical protein
MLLLLAAVGAVVLAGRRGRGDNREGVAVATDSPGRGAEGVLVHDPEGASY